MTSTGGADRGLAVWCGWVLAGLLALTPIAAWLGPLSFAPLVALAGLLTLPALSLTEADEPAAIALVVLVVWAASSWAWSPFKATSLDEATALKLLAQAPLYWAVVCAARMASPATRRIALAILVWGVAGLGLILTVEGLTGGALYIGFRALTGDPIRDDLGARNVAQGVYVLTVLLPPAILAAARTGRSPLFAAPMVAGLVVGGLMLKADAPILALAAAAAVAGVVRLWPRVGPRVVGVLTGLVFMTAPLLVWGARRLGWYGDLEAQVEPSWAQRMSYWRHAQTWIADHPLRGWGLDASRMFKPGIHLHPHDAALQIWLELGLIGAVSAAVFWLAAFWRLSRTGPDGGAAAGAASATAFLVIGAVSFGVWQEWWLALGGLSAALCTLAGAQASPAAATGRSSKSGRMSTITLISE